MATTLYDYYKTKGQSLPSVQERAKTFEQLGLGSGTAYKGTYDQNVSLLSALQKPAPPAPIQPAAPPPAPPAPSATPSSTINVYGQNVPTQTSLLEQYRKQLGLDKLTEDVSSAISSAPKRADIYTKESAALDPQRQQVKSLDTRISEMESALDASEDDIRKRITESGGLVTESQVQRLIASEKKPLVDAYNKTLGERNRLATSLGDEERRVRERSDLMFEDSQRDLTVAQSKLKTASDLFGQYFGAASKDLELQIKAAEDAATKRKADVITTQVDEGGNVSVVTREADGSFKVNKVGNIGKPQKQSTGSSDEAYDANDIEAYALELLNNPNFDTSNVPQKIRAKVLRKRDEIVAEAEAPKSNPVSLGPLTSYPNLQGLTFSGSANSTLPFLQPAAGSFSLFGK